MLVCDVCGLDSVPPELAHLARLETLRLVRKQLAALPGVDVPRAASATTPSPGVALEHKRSTSEVQAKYTRKEVHAKGSTRERKYTRKKEA